MESFVDLKVRFLIGSISVLVVGFLTFFANHPVFQWVITCLVAILGVTALWEYINLLKAKGITIPFWLLASLSAIYIIANYLATEDSRFLVLVNAVVVVFFFAVFLYNFYQIEGAIIKIATSFFGAFYIIVPLGLLLKILYPNTMNPLLHDGRLWVAYLVAVTKITDMGGYFMGKMWGKSKLAPHLSPGKTLIGGVAGFISAILLSLGFFLISKYFDLPDFKLNFLHAVILGGLIGVFSQLGDLAESLLKRDAKVKDSNAIPGVGGVLDFLDSLLFTLPVLYLFLKAIGT
jgi:phosphatidate cytidylyltransferase